MAVKHERCPKCHEKGRDTRGDNLARYADGHGHCFACEYHEWRDASGIAASGTMANAQELIEQARKQNELTLPGDAVENIDYTALTWLSKYEIEMNEVKKYGMLWSPSKKMLIFPFYANDDEPNQPKGRLLGWQARVFNPNYQQKYYKVGGFSDFFNVLNLHDSKGHDIVIVEDFISAIKIARKYASIALLGSNLSTARMKQLNLFAEDLTFWLDEDKAEKAMSLAKTATMLGFRARYIITKHDPKEYDNQQIAETLDTPF